MTFSSLPSLGVPYAIIVGVIFTVYCTGYLDV